MHKAGPEDVLDELSSIVIDLTAIREETRDPADRAALSASIRSLSAHWRRIDDARAALSEADLEEARSSLESIALALRTERSRLERVTHVIRGASQAIAIAERVAREIH